MSETDLIFLRREPGNIFPPFSARECTQTLTPLRQGEWRRTVNGTLIHVGGEGHRKFQSLIQCKDKATPAFEGFWEGSGLRVGCIQTLTQTVPPGPSQSLLERESVSRSLQDRAGKQWSTPQCREKVITLPPTFPGGFLIYRPWLEMRIKTYHLETDEWGATVGWSLTLEEE